MQEGRVIAMNKLNINLENCYGIKKLQKEFDFSDGSAFVIYASNGSMKTSFTKTLKDISNGESPKEEVFGRESICVIEDEAGEAIKPEDIFVIESYDADFYSKRMSNLLMNRTLQEKYDSVAQSISSKKTIF